MGFFTVESCHSKLHSGAFLRKYDVCSLNTFMLHIMYVVFGTLRKLMPYLLAPKTQMLPVKLFGLWCCVFVKWTDRPAFHMLGSISIAFGLPDVECLDPRMRFS